MKKFEHELDAFRSRLVSMGNLTERMVRCATDAISAAAADEFLDAVEQDEVKLDSLQVEIDKEAIRLLTVYSPVAADLRMIMSITRITTELERIGDNAVNVLESLQLVRQHGATETLPSIHRMSTVVSSMIHDALNAFAQGDIHKARQTIASDNIVDALNDQVVGELLNMETVRKVVGRESDMAAALGQMLISRSLERIADQATNISEEVVYMVQGRDIRHSPEHDNDVSVGAE